MKAGFIGLGIMGKPMAMNILKAGKELMVYDLNEEVVAELVGLGATKATIKEIGTECFVCSSLYICCCYGWYFTSNFQSVWRFVGNHLYNIR